MRRVEGATSTAWFGPRAAGWPPSRIRKSLISGPDMIASLGEELDLDEGCQKTGNRLQAREQLSQSFIPIRDAGRRNEDHVARHELEGPNVPAEHSLRVDDEELAPIPVAANHARIAEPALRVI